VAVRGKLTLAVHFTFEYPNLDTDLAINRLRFRKCIVYVGTEGMQRNASLLILFRTGNLGAA
jgi:hypothetical protein